MKVRIFLGFILILFLFQLGNAQTITLEEFLESVKQTHPFFAKEVMSSEIEKKGKERFLGSQDWIIRSSPFYVHQKPIPTGSFTPERIDMLGIGAALAKS